MMDGATEAGIAQRRALHPGTSVWVAASAGTGKTKVLTDRLLALMLDGTDPARILCLTFTRAAAAEMANRINQRLAAWTTLPGGRLAEELVALTGHYPPDEQIARARQLFARVLDIPGGAKIATIHAFCQSLLRRFPLEAGVAPEFAVMEERSAQEALTEACEAVILDARAGTEPGLADALAIVARYVADERFTALMSSLAAERAKLRQALADGEVAFDRRLCARLGIPADITIDGVIAAFCAGGDIEGLRAAAEALARGSSPDQTRGTIIARWCASPADRPVLLETYIPAFLTDKGDIRETLITKGAANKARPADPGAVLQAEAGRLLRSAGRPRQRRAASKPRWRWCGSATRCCDAYERRKRLHGLLDYDDLITKSLELLRRPGVAPWVLFKLDGGLDHILIDEAQDTNPEQWDIVAALAAEFFAGEGSAGDRVRTVFAVGDAKQSIYSFQRADPRRLHRDAAAFPGPRHRRAAGLDRRARWKSRSAPPRRCCRRSMRCFSRPTPPTASRSTAAPIRHVAARAGHAGLVELWPPVVPAPEDPPDPAEPTASRHRTARAAHPRSPAPSPRRSPAGWRTASGWKPRGRPIRPSDIMVLVRRRNAFVDDLLRALKQRDVPVAGADRLVLTEQLAVRDLIALGQFLLLPEDDLTLATVLKGPLFGLGEDELYRLAYDRGGETLWSRLRRFASESLTPVCRLRAAARPAGAG